MSPAAISRAALGRLPLYLRYLQSLSSETVSATTIANALSLGEVQVRKDLSVVSGAGRPRIGYVVSDLIASIMSVLHLCSVGRAVVVGSGSLADALLGYPEFSKYGAEIAAGFVIGTDAHRSVSGKPVYPLDKLEDFCRTGDIRLGVLAVPEEFAQEVCDVMVSANIIGILNLSPCRIKTPDNVIVQHENLALSLANLNMQLGRL